MNCRQAREAMAEGALDDALGAHLDLCSRCRTEWLEMRALAELVAEATRADLAPDAARRAVESAFRRAQTRPVPAPARGLPARGHLAWAVVAAAAFLLGFAMRNPEPTDLIVETPAHEEKRIATGPPETRDSMTAGIAEAVALAETTTREPEGARQSSHRDTLRAPDTGRTGGSPVERGAPGNRSHRLVRTDARNAAERSVIRTASADPPAPRTDPEGTPLAALLEDGPVEIAGRSRVRIKLSPTVETAHYTAPSHRADRAGLIVQTLPSPPPMPQSTYTETVRLATLAGSATGR